MENAIINLTDILQILKNANVPYDVEVSDDVYSAGRQETRRHIQVIETVGGETVVDIWDDKIEEINLNASKSEFSKIYRWASDQVDVINDVSFWKSTLGLDNLDNVRRANKMAENIDDKAFKKLDRGFFEMVAKNNNINIKEKEKNLLQPVNINTDNEKLVFEREKLKYSIVQVPKPVSMESLIHINNLLKHQAKSLWHLLYILSENIPTERLSNILETDNLSKEEKDILKRNIIHKKASQTNFKYSLGDETLHHAVFAGAKKHKVDK